MFYKPLGLTNPINHCYLNSVLQIIFHLLKTNTWDKFNDNLQGDILRKIVFITTLNNLPKSTIGELKYSLKSYDNFLSGSHQQDACECFMTFMDIIHKGTQYSLVQGVEDDDSAVSLTNSMFTSIYEKYFTCLNCGNTTSCHWESRMLYILPLENNSLDQLIQKTMSQIVHKNCAVCQNNTEHSEVLKWICFPK